MRELAGVITTSNSSIEMRIDDDDLDADWVSENQTRTETATPSIGKLEIPVHELYANPFATQKMLDDADFNAEKWLAQKMGDKFARLEATATFEGDGIEKPRGIFTFPHGTGRGKIEQVASGAATSSLADNLIQMVGVNPTSVPRGAS